MNRNKLPITIIIPVKNEERNLSACLAQLKRFSKVIVVDSGSTDRTLDIAREFNADILEFNWNGQYPKKRNWVLMNHKPDTEWVLFLDADEVVSESFVEALASELAETENNGFWLNYTNYFLSKELKHGLAQRKLALFRVGSGLYEKIKEDSWSSLDMEVHEHPVIEGNIGEISEKIDHRDFRGIDKFLGRHVDYARWESRRFLQLMNGDGITASHLTSRQKLKYRYFTRWHYPWVYFFYTYVMKGGFLDGGAGFQYAFYKAWYFSTIRLIIREEKNRL